MTLTIRYNQLMERLVLSQEAAERILAATQSQAAGTSRPASRRAPSRRVLGIAAACLALMVCCSLLLPRLHQTENPVVEKPSYVVEYDTLEELTASLTFPLQIPSVVPEGYTCANYVNQFGMAQVIWTCGEKQLKYYMLDGPMNDTGSSYSLHKTVDGVHLSGNEEGWLVAEWSDETYSYALVSLGTALPEEDFLNAAHSLETVS